MINLELKDFSSSPKSRTDSSQVVNLSSVEAEELRLTNFEAGYKAGLADATKMNADDQSSLSQALVQSVQDMAFSTVEAQAHVMKCLGPFLEELVSKTLPKVAHETLVPLIVENLSQLADNFADQTIELRANAENISAIENALKSKINLPLRFEIDHVVPPTKVQVSCGATSINIDPNEALKSLSITVEQFFNSMKES